jgi:hypothetical protein
LAAFSNQNHDFNPGFGPAVSPIDSGNGFGARVFWIAVIPDGDLEVHPGAGTAELHVRNLAELDYHDFNASVGPQWQTDYFNATVSFDVVWSDPVTRRVDVKDAADGFAGHFNEDQATVTWSAHSDSGFSFRSNLGDFSTSVPGNFFAQVGQERNGIFFPTPGGDGSGRDSTLTTGTVGAVVLGRPGDSHASGTDLAALALAHALVNAVPAPAGTGPALIPARAGADGPASPVTGNGDSMPFTSAPALLRAVAHQRAVDQVFADLSGGTAWNDLDGMEGSAWTV